MRIRIEASDRLPFWIIGDPSRNERDVENGEPGHSQTLNENWQISRNQQAMSGAEWDAKKFFDRCNKSVGFEAQTRLAFSTEIELLDFLQSLAPISDDDELHRWEGDVWLRHSPGDNSFKEYCLPDAVVSLSGTQREGAIGLRLTYRIQAGGFDPTQVREGDEAVALVAPGQFDDTCQLVLFGTTSGGAFDQASTVFAGSAPATVPAGTILSIVIGDNAGVTTTKTFQVVAPGGSASGGRIAVETPFINNLATIAAAFSGITGIRAVAAELDGRKLLYLGWTAAPVDTLAEIVINLSFENATLGDGSVYYEIGSTGASFNQATLPDVLLTDDDGIALIADADA